MRSLDITSAAVPPLARDGRRAGPASEFLRMPGIFFGCVLLISLLLCCEVAVVLAYGNALREFSRIYVEMRPTSHDADGTFMGSDADNEYRKAPPAKTTGHP